MAGVRLGKATGAGTGVYSSSSSSSSSTCSSRSSIMIIIIMIIIIIITIITIIDYFFQIRTLPTILTYYYIHVQY